MGHYPHVCPSCGSRAYVGLNNVECMEESCKHSTAKAEPVGAVMDGGPLVLPLAQAQVPQTQTGQRMWSCISGHFFHSADSNPFCPNCGSVITAVIP